MQDHVTFGIDSSIPLNTFKDLLPFFCFHSLRYSREKSIKKLFSVQGLQISKCFSKKPRNCPFLPLVLEMLFDNDNEICKEMKLVSAEREDQKDLNPAITQVSICYSMVTVSNSQY